MRVSTMSPCSARSIAPLVTADHLFGECESFRHSGVTMEWGNDLRIHRLNHLHIVPKVLFNLLSKIFAAAEPTHKKNSRGR